MLHRLRSRASNLELEILIPVFESSENLRKRSAIPCSSPIISSTPNTPLKTYRCLRGYIRIQSPALPSEPVRRALGSVTWFPVTARASLAAEVARLAAWRTARASGLFWH